MLRRAPLGAGQGKAWRGTGQPPSSVFNMGTFKERAAQTLQTDRVQGVRLVTPSREVGSKHGRRAGNRPLKCPRVSGVAGRSLREGRALVPQLCEVSRARAGMTGLVFSPLWCWALQEGETQCPLLRVLPAEGAWGYDCLLFLSISQGGTRQRQRKGILVCTQWN